MTSAGPGVVRAASPGRLLRASRCCAGRAGMASRRKPQAQARGIRVATSTRHRVTVSACHPLSRRSRSGLPSRGDCAMWFTSRRKPQAQARGIRVATSTRHRVTISARHPLSRRSRSGLPAARHPAAPGLAGLRRLGSNPALRAWRVGIARLGDELPSRVLMVRDVIVEAPGGSWGTPGGPGSRPPCGSSVLTEDPATSWRMEDGLRRDAESPGFRPGLACASPVPTTSADTVRREFSRHPPPSLAASATHKSTSAGPSDRCAGRR
jgi:hypothetical protein